MNTDRLALPAVGIALAARYGTSPGYQRLRAEAMAGRIPAYRSPTGRWSVAVCDIPAVAARFDLDRHAS